LLARETTPSAIVRYLDQYVIGQDEAKKILAVAVYSHYRKIATFAKDKGAIAKSNVLLVGPSGTGKTLLCDTLSRMLDVPFVTADATSLAQTKYVNEEIEAALQRLLDKADGNIEDAQHGIIFIDEIDKLKSDPQPVASDFGRERAARAAENHGRFAGQAEEQSVHRYQQHPVHLRWSLRRPREHHVQDAWFRVSSPPRRTTTRTSSTG
jgi:ATP-dependent protease HslVU (ClpYQ) ATPase subunit